MHRLRSLINDERPRFLFVGGINTVFGYAVFAVLYLTAGHLIGYLGSLYLSYVSSASAWRSCSTVG